MALKQYKMSGTLPIIVRGYGRVEPGAPPFTCEMDEDQEAFFTTIGAIRSLRDELPEGAKPTTPLKPTTPAWPGEVVASS
jgi:hypothetical protein